MKKVMLVEDEEFILQGLKNIIDWEELELSVVHMAHDGIEAIKLWKEEPVDIIVTDVNMPFMGGIDLIKNIRMENSRVRFIILTGYDEFEYARAAISLDVENYILKPINEEELIETLKKAIQKIEGIKNNKQWNINDKTSFLQFLTGGLTKEESSNYIKEMKITTQDSFTYAAIMKLELERLKETEITDILEVINKQHPNELHAFYLQENSLLFLLSCETEDANKVRRYFISLQNWIEDDCGIINFISISSAFSDPHQLPERYKEVMKLQKYLMIDGYGSCVDLNYINNRKSKDISIDSYLLNKLILKKDKAGSLNYLEDLFINNVKEEVSVNVLYQLSVKIAMILEDIKIEYKLLDKKKLRDLTEVIEGIYQAEDIFSLKTIFMSEIIEIIDYLHVGESQYTPVVRQVMAEVESNYIEDMNLKTLANKYHMNTSYLGQIFQKEVGCTFSQYLSNMKNSVAKDLILNTNMKINDIAKKVGYTDTSYFYRKFNQCYGVSPTSLREMKKY